MPEGLVAQTSRQVTQWGARLGLTVALLAVVAGIYLLAWRGWQRRARQQSQLPPLLSAPDEPGTPLLLPLVGRYYGSTRAGDWLDRIVVHGLGVRSPATLTLTTEGLQVDRGGAPSFFIPTLALRGARRETGLAGKVLPAGGLLVVTWQHGDWLLDSGFRGEHPQQHEDWVVAVPRLREGQPAWHT